MDKLQYKGAAQPFKYAQDKDYSFIATSGSATNHTECKS